MITLDSLKKPMIRNILKNEHTTSPKDSFNGLLAELIQEIRFNRESVRIEDFKTNLIELRGKEKVLNNIHSQIGESPINYIQEVMDALDEEDILIDEVAENLKTTIRDAAKYQWELETNMDTIDVVVNKFRLTYFVEIEIQGLELSNDKEQIIYDIARQVVSSYNFTFLHRKSAE